MRFIESIRSYFHPQGKFIIYGRNCNDEKIYTLCGKNMYDVS